MTGIYLKCEKCGKTLGCEEVTPKQQGIPTLGRFEGHTLRKMAGELGWKHIQPNEDICPDCAKES